MKIYMICKNLIKKEILEQTFNSTDHKESCILIELPHLQRPSLNNERRLFA